MPELDLPPHTPNSSTVLGSGQQRPPASCPPAQQLPVKSTTCKCQVTLASQDLERRSTNPTNPTNLKIAFGPDAMAILIEHKPQTSQQSVAAEGIVTCPLPLQSPQASSLPLQHAPELSSVALTPVQQVPASLTRPATDQARTSTPPLWACTVHPSSTCANFLCHPWLYPWNAA